MQRYNLIKELFQSITIASMPSDYLGSEWLSRDWLIDPNWPALHLSQGWVRFIFTDSKLTY